jgi:hypothetical protein
MDNRLEGGLVPKIRGFKSDLWTDEDFVELSPYARLLWMGMWNYACDNGHLADKSKQIKMRVLPTDDVNCAELLRELETNGRIVRANGVITIPNFTKHQKPDKRYFVTCHLAPCPKPDTDSQRETRSGHHEARSGPTVASWWPHDEVNRSEVKGSDGEGGTKARKRATQLPSDFAPSDKHRTLAAESGVDLARELTKFSDHHRAKGSTMKDWNAALNNWIRRSAEYAGNVRPLRPVDAEGRPVLPPPPKPFFDQ